MSYLRSPEQGRDYFCVLPPINVSLSFPPITLIILMYPKVGVDQMTRPYLPCLSLISLPHGLAPKCPSCLLSPLHMSVSTVILSAPAEVPATSASVSWFHCTCPSTELERMCFAEWEWFLLPKKEKAECIQAQYAFSGIPCVWPQWDVVVLLCFPCLVFSKNLHMLPTT